MPVPGRPGSPTPITPPSGWPRALSASAGEIAVCSTGLIGDRLPMDRLLPGVDAAVAAASADGGAAAADAIRTTDTVAEDVLPGRARLHDRRHGQGRRHAGAGAGHDAGRAHHRRRPAAPRSLTPRCAEAVRTTFDRLDTDGCMSTNDTVLLLASGASGGPARSRRLRQRC